MKKSINTQLLVVMLVALVGACSPALLGQAQGARLHGQVTDPSGAVIPDANVSLKNSSGLSVNAKSDGAGQYDVKGLAPGKYTLTVAAEGFTKSAQEITLAAGQDKKLDLPLEIKTKEEEVVVESEGARVSTNPDSNASTLVISGKDLDALSDDPDELQSELQALAGPSAGPNGGQIYIDGFTGGQLPPKSSIREIRINQNPFSAQYDRMGFGRIEILTKPGTDKVHGQFFFNDNHSIFDALNPFGTLEPDFSSQIFNGNVGGPLSKKASYFFNIERRNIHDAAVIDPGAFAAAGIAPQGVLNPRDRTNLSARLDYQLTPSNTFMARYQFTDNQEQNDGIGTLSLPSQAYNQSSIEHTIQISDTQVLSPRAVNETRFEWQRDVTDQNSLSTAPAIITPQFTGGGNSIGNAEVALDHYELQNYTSINLNTHFLRLGGRLRVNAETNTSLQGFNGTFIFDTTGAFNNGVNAVPSQLVFTRGQPTITNTFVDTGLYAEDDWKIRQNMTLSYGLRFETQNGIRDHADWAPRLGFAWGIGGKKNKQPKTILRSGFGIFYDRFAQNLIIQADRLNGSSSSQQQFTINNQTPQGQQCLNDAFVSGLGFFSTPAGMACLPGFSTYSIGPQIHAPYTIQAVASLERQLTQNSTTTVTYVHSHGVHQLFSINEAVEAAIQNGTYNPLLPPTPANEFLSEGVFAQNQMLVQFTMRTKKGVSLFGYYALSFANGDTSGAASFPSDPIRGIVGDYGRTNYDVRNRVFFGGTIPLAHGFRVSPFLVANSGGPYNITIGRDLNGDSQFNDRPALATVDPGASAGSCLLATPAAPVCTAPGLPAVNVFPAPGVSTIPANFGNGPAQFTLNVRMSKTFGIGPKVESAQPQGEGQDRRGPGGGGGGRGPGPGGGPRGPGGPMGGIFAPDRSNQRYSLTFSANARNIFNVVNPGTPIGNLSSPQFGESVSLAGGIFNTQSANRRVDFQVMFSF
jgi:hypothetical protein